MTSRNHMCDFAFLQGYVPLIIHCREKFSMAFLFLVMTATPGNFFYVFARKELVPEELR